MRNTMLILATLLFSGCSTTRYIPTPCPTIQPLKPMPDIRFHVDPDTRQIDVNATRRIIDWMRVAKRHDRYYYNESKRLQANEVNKK